MKITYLCSALLIGLLVSGCSLLTYIENKAADYNAALAAKHREEVVTDLMQDNNALLPNSYMTPWFSLSMRQKLKLVQECGSRLTHGSAQKVLRPTLEKLARIIERDTEKIDQGEQERGYRFTAAKLIAISTSKEALLEAIEIHKVNYRIKLEAHFLQADKQHIEEYVEAHADLLKYLCKVDVIASKQSAFFGAA